MPAERVVDAVLLDVDDTLVDTNAAFLAGVAGVVEVFLPHLDDEGRRTAADLWRADAGGYFARYVAGELTLAEQRRLRAEALHAALDGPPLDDESFERWHTTYETAFHAGARPLPGAFELLAALVEHGVPFGAVTNAGTAYQRAKLDAVGLSALPVLVGTDTLGCGKPDPRTYLAGCAALGAEPGRTAYVGNHLDIDARGARAAGLVGVWLDREELRADVRDSDPVTDVLVMATLTEVVAWLDLGGVAPAR